MAGSVAAWGGELMHVRPMPGPPPQRGLPRLRCFRSLVVAPLSLSLPRRLPLLRVAIASSSSLSPTIDITTAPLHSGQVSRPLPGRAGSLRPAACAPPPPAAPSVPGLAAALLPPHDTGGHCRFALRLSV